MKIRCSFFNSIGCLYFFIDFFSAHLNNITFDQIHFQFCKSIGLTGRNHAEYFSVVRQGQIKSQSQLLFIKTNMKCVFRIFKCPINYVYV